MAAGSPLPVNVPKGSETPSNPSTLPEPIPITRVPGAAAQQTVDQLRNALSAAGRRMSSLRDQVIRFAHERPLQFLEIIAGASFLAGVGLRIWRSRRYE
jgi:hypothetical protein